MGLIEFCKKATKRKSKKLITKRKVEEFRGCGVECTAEQLIEAFNQQPAIVSLGEVLSLDMLLREKGDKFKFELLHKNFEAAAYMLCKVYSAPEAFRFYKKWLLVSGKVISCRDIDRIVNNRIKHSETVTRILNKAIDEKKENWIVNSLPDRTGECFDTTMYAVSDKEFKEPYVHTCEYLGNGQWDTPNGFYVAAWKVTKPYVPESYKDTTNRNVCMVSTVRKLCSALDIKESQVLHFVASKDLEKMTVEEFNNIIECFKETRGYSDSLLYQ